MRRPLVVPKLGLTMTEGSLVEWLLQPGMRFEAGQTLFIIESEKAGVEVPAEAAGTLLEADAPIGTPLPVGTVIGYWDDGEAGGEAGEGVAAPSPAVATPVAAPTTRLLVTPLARRIARERGIDLARVRGSGPRGRIRARDLEAPVGAEPAQAASAPSTALGSAAGRLRPATPIEQVIARRLTQSKRDIPHFYLSVEPEVSRLLALREEINALGDGLRLTINHFILAAVGRALKDVPEANCVWTEEGVLSLDGTDVGMAVDTDHGLMVPVLRDIGRASLAGLAEQARAAADKARAARLAPADMAGGSITVSNAGMHDVSHMASIINPSQSMILGVGSVRQLFRPDADGQPLLHREIGLVLSADHRVLDGVRALRFLKRVTGYLEQPLRLLMA
ncbi:dihydrolipoamide acetyltransferase family protein [Reyranella sp.]|uniref:dihydrolipoamide acetyltransferase family protein n=1 Tax=Reyranella sp. TaxID=1929291 RepID=UPI003D0BBD2A